MNKKIKTTAMIFAGAVVMILCVILGLSDRLTVVGSWYGDGTFDIIGVNTPFEFATKLDFDINGTLTVTTESDTTVYNYNTTDDTITIQGDDVSWGIYYEVAGENLKLKEGRDFSIFTR